MKKYRNFIVLALIISFSSFQAFSQAQPRYCVIDSKYILEKVPQYKQAEDQLEQLSKTWEAEVEKALNEIEQMYRSYQTERPMLSESARQKREEEIITKERQAKDLQKKYFGYDGLLYQKRQELIQPIQDRVFNSVQQYAQSKNYEMVYDKSGGITIFYSHPSLDKSEEIIKLLTK